jgi:hypothetical protein
MRPSISMDGSPVASRFRNDPLWSVAYIYPASPDEFGAPKWGIRSRPPVQLVGLEGLGKNQALCAPVLPMQLISPSSRNLWGRPSEGGATHPAWVAADALIVLVRVDSIEALKLTQHAEKPKQLPKIHNQAGLIHQPRVHAIVMTHCGWNRQKNTPDSSIRFFVGRAIEGAKQSMI